MIFLFFLIAAVSGYLASSLTEYALHRFYLHRNAENDHIRKHHSQFNGISFQQPNADKKDIVSATGYILVNILIYLPLGAFFFILNPLSGFIFMLVGISYTIWVEMAHLRFHKPGKRTFERFKSFLKLKENHYKHHHKYVIRFGIGSLFWDKIMKSK